MKAKHKGWTIETRKATGNYLKGWWFELTNCTEKIISGTNVFNTSIEALKEAKKRVDKEYAQRNNISNHG